MRTLSAWVLDVWLSVKIIYNYGWSRGWRIIRLTDELDQTIRERYPKESVVDMTEVACEEAESEEADDGGDAGGTVTFEWPLEEGGERPA